MTHILFIVDEYFKLSKLISESCDPKNVFVIQTHYIFSHGMMTHYYMIHYHSYESYDMSHTVRLYLFLYSNAGSVIFVSEYADGGDLISLQKRRGSFTLDELLFYAAEMLVGIRPGSTQ